MLVTLTTVIALVALVALVASRLALRAERRRSLELQAAADAAQSARPEGGAGTGGGGSSASPACDAATAAEGRTAGGDEAPGGSRSDPASDPEVAPGSGAHAEAPAGGGRPAVPDDVVEGLWALELLRAARTWRVVAPNGALPAAVSSEPVAELATGVLLELDRLREEAGLPGDLEPPKPPGETGVATAFVTLRLVQEALAVLAPVSEAVDVRLEVGGGTTAVLSSVPSGTAGPDVSVLAVVAERMGASVRCGVDEGRTVLRLDVPDLRAGAPSQRPGSRLPSPPAARKSAPQGT